MTCIKPFSINVTNTTTQMWLTLNSADPNTNIDSVSGAPVVASVFDSPPDTESVPAVISNGLKVAKSGIFSVSSPTLQFDGGSFSICFWMNRPSDSTQDDGFIYQWDGTTPAFLQWLEDTSLVLQVGGNTLLGNFAVGPLDMFHFVALKFDGSNHHLYYSVDGAAWVDAGDFGMAIPAAADPSAFVQFGNCRTIFDEVALFPLALSDAQLAYLWNLGSGRTFPVSLPP